MLYCIKYKNICPWTVNTLKSKTFYIIDSDVLPEVFRKVINAKDFIENGTAKNISQAIKMCNLSRSAFYKYKDSVFKNKKTDSESVELQAILVDRAGVFSSLSGELFKKGANIITMFQTAPENGLATVTLLIGIDHLTIPIDELLKAIERLSGVISVKTL